MTSLTYLWVALRFAANSYFGPQSEHVRARGRVMGATAELRTWCITAVSKTTTKGAARPIGPQRMPQHVLRPAQQAVLASHSDSPHKAQGQGRADKWAGAVVTMVAIAIIRINQ